MLKKFFCEDCWLRSSSNGIHGAPECATENRCTQPTDAQQLKAEIAALITDIGEPVGNSRTGIDIRTVIERLRQLSALCDAIFRFNLINKNKEQLADWRIIKAAALNNKESPAIPQQPQGEICPHFLDDKIQVSENNYQRVATCLCMGKLSPVR
jgi:hypothetical protein